MDLQPLNYFIPCPFFQENISLVTFRQYAMWL